MSEAGRWLTEPGKVVSDELREQGAKFPNIGASRVLEALKTAGYDVVDSEKAGEQEVALFLIQEARIDYEAALRNGEHGAVATNTFAFVVRDALDGLTGVSVPDRVFVDDIGRQWEWCGGVEGTWAWRVTAAAAAEDHQ